VGGYSGGVSDPSEVHESSVSATPSTLPGIQRIFATTHWSRVLSAQGGGSPAAAEALEQLCRTYWYPLYAFARRSGHAPADAEDLTQGFFARLLEADFLKAAAQEKGRFRSFLLVALKRYMANEWDREHAGKRGGFAERLSIDPELGETLLAGEPSQIQPDLLYDRQWARTLLDRTLETLRQEYMASGRATLFEHLQPCLAREETALPYADIATRLRLTEAAVKMAVHRLRGRYREILRAEIAQTVTSEAEVEEEIQSLFSAFGG